MKALTKAQRALIRQERTKCGGSPTSAKPDAEVLEAIRAIDARKGKCSSDASAPITSIGESDDQAPEAISDTGSIAPRPTPDNIIPFTGGTRGLEDPLDHAPRGREDRTVKDCNKEVLRELDGKKQKWHRSKTEETPLSKYRNSVNDAVARNRGGVPTPDQECQLAGIKAARHLAGGWYADPHLAIVGYEAAVAALPRFDSSVGMLAQFLYKYAKGAVLNAASTELSPYNSRERSDRPGVQPKHQSLDQPSNTSRTVSGHEDYEGGQVWSDGAEVEAECDSIEAERSTEGYRFEKVQPEDIRSAADLRNTHLRERKVGISRVGFLRIVEISPAKAKALSMMKFESWRTKAEVLDEHFEMFIAHQRAVLSDDDDAPSVASIAKSFEVSQRTLQRISKKVFEELQAIAEEERVEEERRLRASCANELDRIFEPS